MKKSTKPSNKKKNILDKLGNVDNSTKKLIKEEKTLEIEEPVKKKRKTNNEYIYLKPNENDTLFESFIKYEVNRRNITQEFVNKRLKKILALDDRTAANRGYNMVYVTNKGVTITTDRLDLWIKILGLKNVNIEYEEPSEKLMSHLES